MIAFFSWASVARIVRGQVLSIREREYVEAARSLGASDRRIMFVDVLPNVLAPVIVYTTLLIPLVIVVRGHAVVPRARRARADRRLGRDDRRLAELLPRRLVVPRSSPASRC